MEQDQRLRRLAGCAAPNGYPGQAWFEWGTTTNYGSVTTITNAGTNTIALPLDVGAVRGVDVSGALNLDEDVLWAALKEMDVI